MKVKFFLLLILFVSKVFAQYGGLDLTFNPGISTGSNYFIRDVDYNKGSQKILISGNFLSFDGVPNKAVAVLDANGKPLSGFTSPWNTETNALYASNARWLPNNKIIIYGYIDTIGHFLKRLNADGSIDTSFSLSINGAVNEIFIETDGKILISGAFTTVGGVPRNGIARITNTGFVDATFYPASGIHSGQYIYGIDKQSTGKYVVGGNFDTYDGHSVNNIARLNTDGSFDTTFNTGTAANNTIADVTVLKDDKIIVSGIFTQFNNISNTNKIVQLQTNGDVDNTVFLGKYFTIAPNSIVNHVVLADDQIIIYSSDNFTFDGSTIKNKIAKINKQGFLNYDFDAGTAYQDAFSTYIDKTIALPTGNLLSVGDFDTYDGNSRQNITKILNKLDNPSSSYCHQISGRISSFSGTTNGRIFTNGNTSICGIAKPFPGVIDAGNLYYYNTHTFTNNSSVSQCVTFHLKTLANNNELDLAIYNGTFNNTNLSQNYVADVAQITSLGNSKSCSVTVAPYQTIVCVVTENTPNYNTANGNYVLSIDGLCNSPTVTIKAMPGFDYSTRKPVVYYSAKFNMPIAGLTASDIVIDTDTGSSTKAFIKDTGLASNNKDFIIGVTGMQNEGYVDIKIPVNSVFSLDEGTANLSSINLSDWSERSGSQTTFLVSYSCTKPSSDGALHTLNDVNIYSTPNSNCEFTRNYFIDRGLYDSKVHTYQNTSGFDKCIGIKIKKNGNSSYNFNTYKTNSFLSGNYLTDWIGGSDGSVYTYDGNTYDCSYIDVPNGGNFYIQVFTANNDYEIILTDIYCFDILANEKFVSNTNFKIYPNPSQSTFNISSDEKIEKVKIIDMLGQIILETNSNVIDLSARETGIYLVEVTINGKKTTKRIIKD